MFIEIKELYFKYPKSKNDIIDNFNMSLEKGEILSILGESGSGKSTILRIIAGLEESYKGEIKIGGKIVFQIIILLSLKKRSWNGLSRLCFISSYDCEKHSVWTKGQK